MTKKIIIFLFLLPVSLFSQNSKEISSRFFTSNYLNSPIEYVVQSKRGEEYIKKPLLLLCQGSLPRPLFLIEGNDFYPIFLPFNYENFLINYHLVVISKPGIPISLPSNELNSNYMYLKPDNRPPKKYIENDNLQYYLGRNISVIEGLFRESWICKEGAVVIGHSEGSYVALSMAVKTESIDKIIYSGGNPFGRIMSLISQYKINDESEKDSEELFTYWKDVISDIKKDTNLTSFSSSKFMDNLVSLKIPVLVTYGSKDWNAIFNDALRIETLRLGLNNFTFKVFYGTDHNFFSLDSCYKKNSTEPFWQDVGDYWLSWLNNN